MIDGWTGIELLDQLQNLRLSLPDFVTTFFEIISSSLFYLAVPFFLAIIFYWFIDKRAGDRLALNTLCAYNLVSFFKFIFKQPRPWVLDPNLHPTEASLEHAGGYSFPSGHSTIAAAGYGTAALFFKKNWLKILCIVIIVLITFSRLFLSVHTPLDVMFGVLIALVVIYVNSKILDFGDRNDGTFYFISLLYIILYSVFFIVIMTTIDQDHSKVMMGIGLFYGAFIGRVIERAYVKYDIPQLKISRVIIYTLVGLIGIGIMIGIPFALKLGALCAVGGILTGIWIFVVFPMIITKWK